MLRFFPRTIMRGLVVVVPIVAAAYVLVWLARDTERAVRRLVFEFMPDAYERYYVPGMGIAALVVALFLVGLLAYPWITRSLLDRGDRAMRRIPLFGSIYSPVRDLMDMVGGDMADQLGQPVLVTIPGTDIQTLGFITRQDLSDLPGPLRRDGCVVVYVQWSAQIGGYCFLVPRDALQPVPISVQDGMRWALTAGASKPDGQSPGAAPATAQDGSDDAPA